MKRLWSGALLLGPAVLLSACSEPPKPIAPAPSPTIAASVPSPTVVAPTLTDTKTVANKDGSTTVIKTYSDGSKHEERTFKTGELATVRRVTSASGEKTGYVVYRKDNSEVEVKDPSWVEKSMDATGNALAVAARKTESGVKTGVGATVEGAKTAASATVSGAKTAGEKTAEGAKTVAGKTAEGAKVVGEKTVEGAKATGKGIKKLGEKIKP